MRPRLTVAFLALALLLTSCDDGLQQGSGDFNTVTAKIDGRLFHVDGQPFYSSVAGESVTITMTDETLFNVIARHTTDDCREVLQVTLLGFQGTGAYTLGWYGGAGRSGIAVVGCEGQGHWSDDPPSLSDSAWVTVYDSVSKHVEGKFNFRSAYGSDSVVVTDGTFSGTVSRK